MPNVYLSISKNLDMWSFVEINDTLQITYEQWFPKILDVTQHFSSPFTAQAFVWQTFSFTNKPKIRNYQQPPVRNFLVHNLDGKRIYRGTIHILEITHDYVNITTSWTFKIEYIYTPDEMKVAHDLLDKNEETRFFRF